MSYFNHAFKKSFLATGRPLNTNVALLDGTTVAAVADWGYLTTTGLPTYVLNSLSVQAEINWGPYQSGYIGFFDPKTNVSLIPEKCCNVYKK